MDQTERRDFVRAHRTAIFGYNRREDGPAMTVVYYVMDPGSDDIDGLTHWTSSSMPW